MLQTAFGPSCISQASVFQWHKRFKEGRESQNLLELYNKWIAAGGDYFEGG